MKALPLALAVLLALASAFTARGQSSCANASLSTPFNANGGQSGNMFDIRCITPANVLVESFACNLDAGVWDMEIYSKEDSYLGHEQSASSWVFVGSASGIVSAGFGVPTPVPIPVNLGIPDGQTRAFYVTVSNGTAINYTTGSSPFGGPGSVLASDSSLEVTEGSGNAYPFGAFFLYRRWNGVICYQVGWVPPPAEYQKNSAAASATINGINGYTQIPAVIHQTAPSCIPPIPATGTFELSTTDNPGAFYETVLSDANMEPLSVTNLSLGGTEIVNLSIASNLTYVNGGSAFRLLPMPFSSFPGAAGTVALASTYSIDAQTDLSTQSVVTNSSAAPGYRLTQATELHIDTTIPAVVQGPTGDDTYLAVGLTTPPTCWLASGVAFYGALHSEIFVNANGRVMFGG